MKYFSKLRYKYVCVCICAYICICICVFVYMSICTSLAYLVPVEAKTGYQILTELELKTVVNCHMGTGN